MSQNFIGLGRVGRPFGIRGEIKLRPYNPDTEWFDHSDRLWLRRGEGEPELFRVLKARRHGEAIVLKLEGVDDRDRAFELRDREAVVPEADLPELPEDEFYWHQLIGLRVETATGEALGEIIRIESTAPELDGNDVLVAFGDKGEVLIPATTEAVEKIELEAGRMIVNREAVTVPE